MQAVLGLFAPGAVVGALQSPKSCNPRSTQHEDRFVGFSDMRFSEVNLPTKFSGHRQVSSTNR
jgi:hypothetical protein